MAIVSLVMDAACGKNEAGDVIQAPEEMAKVLCSAGLAHEATEEELMPNEDEATEGDADEAPEEGMEEEECMRNLSADAKNIVLKATEEAVKKLTDKVSRPNLSTPKNPHVKGSDEWITGGFKNIGDFAHARMQAAKGDWESAKKVKRFNEMRVKYSPTSMGISASHIGSDMVPQQWADYLWKLSFKNVPDLMGAMTKYDMKYQVENIPVWVQSSATSAVQANTIAEGSAITATTGVTATVQLTLQKGAVLVNVTDELQRFTPYHIGTVIEQVAPERIRYLVNDSVVNGTSSGINLIGNASTVTVIAQTPGSVQYKDILNMEAALFDDFEGDDTVWLCNKATLPSLYAMGFPNNSASTQIPVFTPGGFSNPLGAGTVRAKGQLLGRPLYTLENVPGLGTRGALILVSLKSLAAGYSGLIADSTPYLYFNQAIDTWRFLFYFNQVNPLTVPYTREYGGTASNIVILSAGSTSSS